MGWSVYGEVRHISSTSSEPGLLQAGRMLAAGLRNVYWLEAHCTQWVAGLQVLRPNLHTRFCAGKYCHLAAQNNPKCTWHTAGHSTRGAECRGVLCEGQSAGAGPDGAHRTVRRSARSLVFCSCLSVRACVRACVHACVCARVHAFSSIKPAVRAAGANLTSPAAGGWPPTAGGTSGCSTRRYLSSPTVTTQRHRWAVCLRVGYVP